MRFLLSILSLVALFASPVLAGDGPDGQEDHHDFRRGCHVERDEDCKRNHAPRTNRITLDDHGFFVHSRTDQDVFDMKWTGVGDRFEVDWRVGQRDQPPPPPPPGPEDPMMDPAPLRRLLDDRQGSGFRFRWRLFGLVEFEPGVNSTTNALDADSQLCKTTRVRGDDFTWSAALQTVNDTNVTVVTATNGLVTVVARIAGEIGVDSTATTFEVDNTTITARSFKFDIDLNLTNYEWNCTNSRIALVAFVKSASRVESSNGTVISFGQGALDASRATSGVFTWDDKVTVNGDTEVDVLASPLRSVRDDDDDRENDSARFAARAVFAFDTVQPTTVHWDPVLAAPVFESSTNAMCTALSLLLSVFVALW